MSPFTWLLFYARQVTLFFSRSLLCTTVTLLGDPSTSVGAAAIDFVQLLARRDLLVCNDAETNPAAHLASAAAADGGPDAATRRFRAYEAALAACADSPKHLGNEHVASVVRRMFDRELFNAGDDVLAVMNALELAERFSTEEECLGWMVRELEAPKKADEMIKQVVCH